MDPDPVNQPITPELDLHTFRPSEIGELLPAYFEECRKQGILSIRVIHGKGTGTLRTLVHATLEKIPEVSAYKLAGEGLGGWGATLVFLNLPGESE